MAEWVSLAEAIAANVRDGDTVAMEGFTHLIPFAAGHEIIRRGRRNLSLVRMTPDVLYDQLIGTGCARKLTFSWGGNPWRRFAAPFSRCSRERLAQAAGNRGEEPQRPRECLRCRSLQPAVGSVVTR